MVNIPDVQDMSPGEAKQAIEGVGLGYAETGPGPEPQNNDPDYTHIVRVSAYAPKGEAETGTTITCVLIWKLQHTGKPK